MFKTDVKAVYDVYYLGKNAKDKLFKDLNTQRAVQLGEDILASRNFERAVPYEAERVPDSRVRFEFAHKIQELKQRGKTITPSLAFLVEMRQLENKDLARLFTDKKSVLKKSFPHHDIRPAKFGESYEDGDFWVIKKNS